MEIKSNSIGFKIYKLCYGKTLPTNVCSYLTMLFFVLFTSASLTIFTYLYYQLVVNQGPGILLNIIFWAIPGFYLIQRVSDRPLRWAIRRLFIYQNATCTKLKLMD